MKQKKEKRMKKIALMFLLAAMSAGVHAQDKRVESTVRMDTLQVDYKTRYVSSFWSNFYLQGSFAGRLLCAEEDNHLSVGKRLAPGFLFGIGKQLTPNIGTRLSVGGLRLNGWNTGAPGIYKQHSSWDTATDPVREYYESQGIDTKNGYKQKIKYLELNVDVMLDLYNAFHGHKRFDRRWDFEAYSGLGYLYNMRWNGMSKENKIAFRLGLIGGYNITDRLAVNAEIGTSITSATFDGEIGKGNKFDTFFSGLVGLKWRFGKQGFRVVRLVPSDQYAALNNSVSRIRREVTEHSKTVHRTVTHAATGSELLIPAVVFFPDKDTYNEELQQVNIFEAAHFMEEHTDYKIAVIGNSYQTDIKTARKRAERVRNILINRYSIEPSRLVVRVKDMGSVSDNMEGNQTVNFAVEK